MLRTPSHDYTAYGLHVRSPIALPFVQRPGSRRDASDVLIRLGETPAALPAPTVTTSTRTSTRHLMPGAFLMSITGYAGYLVTDGSNITINPLGGDEWHMEAAVTRRLMIPLLQQRGMATFHASAVAATAGAVLFLGAKGSGKSSLAGALVARGYDLLSEELTGVALDADGRPEVRPAFPQLRLRHDVLDALDWRGQGRRWPPQDSKYTVPVERFRATPVAPCAAFILMSGDGPDIEVERVPPVRIPEWLRTHTLRRMFVHAFGQYQSHFRIVMAFAKSVPFFLVTRPSHPLRLDVLADRIEEVLADAVGCIPLPQRESVGSSFFGTLGGSGRGRSKRPPGI